jgi:excisionase family DNA binding protein
MKWLTTREVGELIHETPENVSRRCNAGQIRAKRLGGSWRIAEDDLVQFMAASNSPAPRVRSTAGRRSA